MRRLSVPVKDSKSVSTWRYQPPKLYIINHNAHTHGQFFNRVLFIRQLKKKKKVLQVCFSSFFENMCAISSSTSTLSHVIIIWACVNSITNIIKRYSLVVLVDTQDALIVRSKVWIRPCTHLDYLIKISDPNVTIFTLKYNCHCDLCYPFFCSEKNNNNNNNQSQMYIGAQKCVLK